MTPRARERIAQLAPALQPLALRLLELCDARGLRVTVCRGRVSYEEQARVHAANPHGSAAPGRSRHEVGEAFDVCFYDARGTWLWDESLPWALVGELGESIGLVWGGRWRSGRWKGTPGDRPHFELPR